MSHSSSPITGRSARSTGIYVSKLSEQIGLARDDVVYRAHELEREGLLEVLSLTDLNIRLHEDVTQLLGSNADRFLSAYLK